MDPSARYRVAILDQDAGRSRDAQPFDELSLLLRGAGYAVDRGKGQDSVAADALVLLGQPTGGHRVGVHVRRAGDDLDCVPAVAVRRATRAGEDHQRLLLRIGLECRRGRLIRTRLMDLGVGVFSGGDIVATHGARARLSPLEYRLLRGIVLGAGEVVPRGRLVRVSWPEGRPVLDATIDSHIRSVRAKLDAGGVPLRIRTVRGAGYAWAEPGARDHPRPAPNAAP